MGPSPAVGSIIFAMTLVAPGEPPAHPLTSSWMPAEPAPEDSAEGGSLSR